MAASGDEKVFQVQEERKIPVFTVIKNGAVLKNIFIINNAPLTSFSLEVEEDPDQEIEETLIVGRHPDCNIVLMHPSISRFHLQISSRPTLQKLFVTDLSSVHGTWVSDKKIEPGFRVELNEGDTLKIGGSTRVYRLHWVPYSHAYDMEYPFDVRMGEEKEEENAVPEEETDIKMFEVDKLLEPEEEHAEEKDSLEVVGNEEEMHQVLRSINTMTVMNGEIQCWDSIVGGIVSLFSDENPGFTGNKMIPSTPLMPEDKSVAFSGGNEEIGSPSRNELEAKEALSRRTTVKEVILETKCEQLNECNSSPDYHPAEEAAAAKEETDSSAIGSEQVSNIMVNLEYSITVTEEEMHLPAEIPEESRECTLLREDQQQTDVLPLEKDPMNLPLQVRDLSATSNQQSNKDSSISVTEVEMQFSTEMPEESGDQTLSTKVKQQMDASRLLTEPMSMSLQVGDLSATSTNKDPWVSVTEVEMLFPTRKDQQQKDPLPLLTEPVNLSSQANQSTMSSQQDSKENLTPEMLPALSGVKEGNKGDSKGNAGQNMNRLSGMSTACSDATIDILEGRVSQSLLKKDYEQNEHANDCSSPLATESVDSSLPAGEVLHEIIDNEESHTPLSAFAPVENLENLNGSRIRSEKKLSSGNIWSRRGKPATPLQLQTSRGKAKKKGAGICAEVERNNQEDQENRSVSKALFSDLEATEDEIFTPDKENYTPNTLLLKSLKKKGKLENQVSKSCKSSSPKIITFCPQMQPQEEDKENQTPQVLQPRKSVRSASKNRVKLEKDMVLGRRPEPERVPLQSLLVNSPEKSLSDASISSVATSSGISVNRFQTVNRKLGNSLSINSYASGRKSWTIIADITSVLDKESRKALQLLQGLKGTHLIIPRMVIRELDCLKRRGSLFRRTTQASLALDWVEECMEKTNWWIHVQSSTEEIRPTAPTPPATPQSQLSGGSWEFPWTSSLLFSARGSSHEVASPTAEDQILDCALLYRKMNIDGQLVLLTNDVTLKIKAIAEGLICETAEEFRDSLANPFSERFLWAESSPRGQTWSVFDDVVLKEKYYPSPSKKSSKGGVSAKGLKLILFHNSHYGRMNQEMNHSVKAM